jgi:hypothetical protein
MIPAALIGAACLLVGWYWRDWREKRRYKRIWDRVTAQIDAEEHWLDGYGPPESPSG